MIFRAFPGLLCGICLFGCTVNKPLGPAARLELITARPLIAAHRAMHLNHSENSLAAIAESVQTKIPLIEVDLRLSTDGVLYLFHNQKVDSEKVQGPKELIGRDFHSLSSTEVNKIILPKGEQVPEFSSVVGAVNSSSSAFILDLKTPLESNKLILEEISKNGLDGAYWFLCYTPECITDVKASKLPVSFIARVGAKLPLQEALNSSPTIIQIDCKILCKEEVTKIKKKLPRSFVLVNSLSELDYPAHWEFLKSSGVDIILTDQPSLLNQALLETF